MKRAILFSALLLILAALTLTGTAEPAADLNPEIAPALSGGTTPSVVGEITTSADLGSITCLCVCQGPIWSIEDVRTNGSCDDLVGDSCWSFGPGIYSSCTADGPGFPF